MGDYRQEVGQAGNETIDDPAQRFPQRADLGVSEAQPPTFLDHAGEQRPDALRPGRTDHAVVRVGLDVDVAPPAQTVEIHEAGTRLQLAQGSPVRGDVTHEVRPHRHRSEPRSTLGSRRGSRARAVGHLELELVVELDHELDKGLREQSRQRDAGRHPAIIANARGDFLLAPNGRSRRSYRPCSPYNAVMNSATGAGALSRDPASNGGCGSYSIPSWMPWA